MIKWPILYIDTRYPVFFCHPFEQEIKVLNYPASWFPLYHLIFTCCPIHAPHELLVQSPISQCLHQFVMVTSRILLVISQRSHNDLHVFTIHLRQTFRLKVDHVPFFRGVLKNTPIERVTALHQASQTRTMVPFSEAVAIIEPWGRGTRVPPWIGNLYKW